MTAAVLVDRVVPIRFAACPQCSDRRRALVETGDGLVGHCLGCGRSLPAPLATECIEVGAARRTR